MSEIFTIDMGNELVDVEANSPEEALQFVQSSKPVRNGTEEKGIPVDGYSQKLAQMATAPERAGGAAAVGLKNAGVATGINPTSIGGITSVDPNTLTQAVMNPKETAGKLMEAGKEAVNALRPGYKPKKNDEMSFSIGKAAVQMMEASALTGPSLMGNIVKRYAINAGITAGLDLTNQTAEGKIYPKRIGKDVVSSAGYQTLFEGPAAIYYGMSKLASKFLPSVLKSTARIPEAYTKRVMSNPELLKNNPGIEAAIENGVAEVQGSLNKFKQMAQGVMKSAYEKVGIQSPIDDVIDEPIAQSISKEVNRGMAGMPDKILYKPGDIFKIKKYDPGMDDLHIDYKTADMAVNKNDSDAWKYLYKKYFQSEGGGFVTDKDKVNILTKIKRNLYNLPIQFDPQTNVVKTVGGVEEGAIKVMADRINTLRGKFTTYADSLNAADDFYSESMKTYKFLQKKLADPGQAEDTLSKMFRGDLYNVTQGRNKMLKKTFDKFMDTMKSESDGKIEDAMAAREFQSYIGKGIGKLFLGTGSIFGAGAALGAGNPATAAAMAVPLSFTSPKLMGYAIRGGQAAGKAAPYVQRAGASLSGPTSLGLSETR